MSNSPSAMTTDGPSSSLETSSLFLGSSVTPHVQYRLYKRRFSGLISFVLLGFVTGMPWAWFGPISTEAATAFAISVNKVNWLSNIVCCIYIPVSLLVPIFCSRFGITRCAQLGTFITLVSGWVRYAGTDRSLPPESAYTLLIFGQIFSAISQPVFQVLGPMYSERWFDLKGRTTSTMVIAIANPIGSAIGQLLAPLCDSVRDSLLVLAIISTAVTPVVFFISEAPPTPPTYSGSKPPQTLKSLCRAVLGLSVTPDARMLGYERLDFIIITILFGVFVGATTTFGVLSDQWFEPVGYTDTTAGLMGAVLLLSGIAASIVIAPLLDRFFTHRLGIALKIFTPIVALGWFSLIWAVRPNNIVALYAIFVVIGICSMVMLPIGLELGVEITRNADASAALLWCSGNLFSIILILAEGALRASSTANPPYNMNHAIILQGVIVLFFGAGIFFVRARQARREMDENMATGNTARVTPDPNTVGKLDRATNGPESMVMVVLDEKQDIESGSGQKTGLPGHDA